MRTAGQGQAAVPREREHRRRMSVPAWAHHPGPQDKILWTVTTVERYPDAVYLLGNGIRFAMVRSAAMVFFCAKNGSVCLPKSK